MDKVILVTRDELKKLIYEVLEDFFKDKDLDKKKEVSDTMSLEDTIEFLRENGYPTSKPSIYRQTSANKIPYRKYGNRLVFSRKELMNWVKMNTVKVNPFGIHDESLEALSKFSKGRHK